MDGEPVYPAVVAEDAAREREKLSGPNDPVVLQGYVRHPPPLWDDPPPLAISSLELPGETKVLLETREAEFRRGNPVAAVESIILRHRAGVYPSMAALEWLAAGLDDWHRHQGRRSLEACLGLRKPAGQAANTIKEAARQQMVQHILVRVLHLRCAFGLKVRDAAELVAAWMAEPGRDTSGFDFRPLDAETIEAQWRGCAWVKQDRLNEAVRQRYEDEAARRALLADYPRWAWGHLPELAAFHKSPRKV